MEFASHSGGLLLIQTNSLQQPATYLRTCGIVVGPSVAEHEIERASTRRDFDAVPDGTTCRGAGPCSAASSSDFRLSLLPSTLLPLLLLARRWLGASGKLVRST